MCLRWWERPGLLQTKCYGVERSFIYPFLFVWLQLLNSTSSGCYFSYFKQITSNNRFIQLEAEWLNFNDYFSRESNIYRLFSTWFLYKFLLKKQNPRSFTMTLLIAFDFQLHNRIFSFQISRVNKTPLKRRRCLWPLKWKKKLECCDKRKNIYFKRRNFSYMPQCNENLHTELRSLFSGLKKFAIALSKQEWKKCTGWHYYILKSELLSSDLDAF